MKKKMLLFIFVLFLFVSVDKVFAASDCVAQIGDKIYKVDYDFFCGNNKNNKVCVLDKTLIGGSSQTNYVLVDANSVKNNNNVTVISNKYECLNEYLNGKQEYNIDKDGCYQNIDVVSGKSTFGKFDYNFNQKVKIIKYVYKQYCNENMAYCGNRIGFFNKRIPEITSWVITILQVAIPILLVIMGGIDFVKAITGQKDDEIRKGQQILIKRIIVAVIIFFVVAITKILVSLVSSGDSESKSIISCIDCFISNKCG